MNAILPGVAQWSIDFAALATVLLAVVLASRWIVRSPGERMAIAWSAWLGLAALAVATALPQWPRLPLPLARATGASEEPSKILPLQEVAWPENELPAADAIETAEVVEDASSPSDGLVDTPAPFMNDGLMEPNDALAELPPLASSFPWQQAWLLMWLTTAGLSLAWITIGMAFTWRLVRRSGPAPAWMTSELLAIVESRSPPRLL